MELLHCRLMSRAGCDSLGAKILPTAPADGQDLSEIYCAAGNTVRRGRSLIYDDLMCVCGG